MRYVMRRQLPANAPEEWRRAAAPPDGARLVEADRPSADLLAARLRAFAAGHVDHAPERAQAAVLDRIVSGREAGPLLPCSRLAVADAEGEVVGVALVTDPPAVGGEGGPWIADIYRDPSPEWAGLGTALLHAVLVAAVEQRHAAIGLAVTEGNPARRLYERLGFRIVREVRQREPA
jgi:GNAT superfamily N-acetyltransferase